MMTTNSRTQPGRKKAWNLFFLALPFMIIVFLMSYVPLFGWLLSLVHYKPGYPLFENAFVGLKYFKMLFASRDIPRVLMNTIIFSTFSFCALPLPMLIAVLLNEIDNRPFRKAAQIITTLPHFISWVIVFSIAYAVFGSEGLLNQLLGLLGMSPQSLLTDRNAVYWFQSLITIWKTLGWNAIIYIAAIAGIDQELYDAAHVDGAGRFRSALHITLPGLMPTFMVLMLLHVSNFITHGMDQYFVFKNAVVYNRIEVLELYVYRQGLQLGDYSYATAVGILKSFVSIALLFSANAVARKVRGESLI